jgi:hypothetical protein
MKRTILAAVLLIVGAVLGSLWTRPVQAGQPCTVPKSWGSVKAFAVGQYGALTIQHLVFEAEDGTIRITSPECGNPPKATVVQRSAD